MRNGSLAYLVGRCFCTRVWISLQTVKVRYLHFPGGKLGYEMDCVQWVQTTCQIKEPVKDTLHTIQVKNLSINSDK